MHFLLDANMPRSTGDAIRAAGHECTHVRDTPLGNAGDDELAAYARTQSMALVTRDFDFADVRVYVPHEYAGIVVLTLPDTATAGLVTKLAASFLARADCLAALPGHLAIVEFGRVRLRPRPPEAKQNGND